MATLESLTEATKPWNLGKKIDWNPDLHPRDRKGRFRDVFKSILKLLEGDYMDLDSVVKDAPHIKSAYVWRTKEGWELRGTSDSGTYGIIVTPEQLGDNEHEFEDALKALNADPPFSDSKKCGCGCGSPVKGTYLPGHDARHKSALVKAAVLGDKDAYATLQQKGWLKFLDKVSAKNTPNKKVDAPEQNQDFDAPDGPTPDVTPDDEQDAPEPDAPESKPDPEPEATEDPGPEEKPPPDPAEVGWEPSAEEEDKNWAEEDAFNKEEEALTDDELDEDAQTLYDPPENYSPSESLDSTDEAMAAVSGNTDKYADIEPYPDLDTCNCGCGGTKSPTAKYLPGHDSRHKSALVKAAKNGDKRAYATLAKKGWLKFLDKALGKDKSDPAKGLADASYEKKDLEYDPSRVPVGMPISDDYENYRLLDPGPGTLDEQLGRLTKRRDNARSVLDRVMLNETMYRLRGGHVSTGGVASPSTDVTRLRGAAIDLILADLGYYLLNDPDAYLTSAGAVNYNKLRRVLWNKTDDFRAIWSNKAERKKYEEAAAKLLDDFSVEGDFFDQAGAKMMSVMDRAVEVATSGDTVDSNILQAMLKPREMRMNDFAGVVAALREGRASGSFFNGTSKWNNIWSIKRLSGEEADPRHDFFSYMGYELEDALREGRDTGDFTAAFSKRNLVWMLVRPEEWRGGVVSAGGEFRPPGYNEKTNSLHLGEMIDKIKETGDISDYAWRLAFHLSLNPRLTNSKLANMSSGFPQLLRSWWKQYGYETLKAQPSSYYRRTAKNALDYRRLTEVGTEKALISKASSHDITLEDQIVNEETAKDILRLPSPDRGKAIFFRDTLLEDDHVMVFGHAEKPLSDAELTGNLSLKLEGRANIDEKSQSNLMRILLDKGAEVKKSTWKYKDNLYGGWAERKIRDAQTRATSLHLDLGDGKRIEYVPDIEAKDTGANQQQVIKEAKEWIDKNLGKGPYFTITLSRGENQYGSPHYVKAVVDADGQIVYMDGAGEDNEAHETLLEMAEQQSNEFLHGSYNPYNTLDSVGLIDYDLRTEKGSLLFRYVRPEGAVQIGGSQNYAYDTEKSAGIPRDDLIKRLEGRFAGSDFKFNPDTVRTVESLDIPSSKLTYKKFNDVFFNSTLGGGFNSFSGIDASNFRYNIRSQRRRLKFFNMTPKEISDWVTSNLDGRLETKVPYTHIYGGDRRQGRPIILQDAYADGTVKPQFGDRGIVHVARGGADLLETIIDSGGIVSISEKIERIRYGRTNMKTGTSPQGDIGSGLDDFAFGNFGHGIDYMGGDIRLVYKSELAMRNDTLLTPTDFGGGSDRYGRYSTYMKRWGGKFGRSIPVENIAGARIQDSSFRPGSNELNFRYEMPIEDVAAVVLPSSWGRPDSPQKAAIDRAIARLREVNPDAKVIFADNHRTSIPEFIKEHNTENGFHNDAQVAEAGEPYARRKINVGDRLLMSYNPHTFESVGIVVTRTEGGEAFGKLDEKWVEQVPAEKRTDYQFAAFFDQSGDPKEVSINPAAIMWMRRALSDLED